MISPFIAGHDVVAPVFTCVGAIIVLFNSGTFFSREDRYTNIVRIGAHIFVAYLFAT